RLGPLGHPDPATGQAGIKPFQLRGAGADFFLRPVHRLHVVERDLDRHLHGSPPSIIGDRWPLRYPRPLAWRAPTWCTMGSCGPLMSCGHSEARSLGRESRIFRTWPSVTWLDM